ncbi:MAG: DedA family protein [Patescibacteria group bacterium]
MSDLARFLDTFLHLDRVLGTVMSELGVWTYALLFAIIFLETGLVITPFLPGDSLLFAAGSFAALGSMDPFILFVTLAAAAILGDTVNYWIGRNLDETLFRVKPEHLEKTRRFYEKYGGKTIILARFVPIVRTVAPFVAGIGRMNYTRFLAYNIVGGVVWVGLFVSLGYFFGNIPIVKKNFSAAILVIVFISILPGIVELIKSRKSKSPEAI